MPRKRTRKPKPPSMEGMVEVNNYNRKKLEKKYGIEIPKDVSYILPPKSLQEPEFWDIYPPSCKNTAQDDLLEEVMEELFRYAPEDS